MARFADGWRLVWRRGIARVRFRHDDRRYEITTGSRDAREAGEAAARIYAEIIGGRRSRAPQLASTQALAPAVAAWLVAITSSLDRRTVREYEIYAAAHWLPRWGTLGHITERALGDYQRERLARVTRTTLRKELSAMRGLLRWCVEQGRLAALPEVPALPRQATGTRSAPLRPDRVVLRPNEARRLLAALSPGRVRNYVDFAYETGLRPVTIFRLRTPDHWERGRTTLRITIDVDKARFARELPLSPRALAVLRRVEPGRGGRLFVGRYDVLEELRERSAEAIGRRVGLYDFRHSRITLLVEAGGPLTGVRYLAGHRHLSTTARYAHAGLGAAREALGALRGPGPRKRAQGAPWGSR